MIKYQPNLDKLFHALADGQRRAIIDHLSKGPSTVSDLAAPLEISLPAVMQHLAVLEGAGLLNSEKRGRVRTCALAPGALTEVEGWISARRKMVEARLDRLGQFLDQQEKDKP